MKRILHTGAMLLVVIMLAGLLLQPASAQTAAATTIRLEKTQGTVSVFNANGRGRSLTESMRLFSGYSLTTDPASYAYLSLDSEKAVKMDASSQAEIKKSGSRLEVMLNSGKLFFNVTVPLEDDESFTIRTSTMTTGIRGTSGWVSEGRDNVTTVYLLDGKVTLRVVDRVTGKARTLGLGAGWKATSVMDNGEMIDVVLEKLTEGDVPGFVAMELRADPALAERVRNESGLDVDSIIGGAADRLEADEEQAGLQPVTEKVKGETIGYFKQTVSPVFVLDASATLDDLEMALQYANATVRLTDSQITVDRALAVEAGQTVDLDGASELTVSAGTTLSNNGTITVSSESMLTNNGSFVNNSGNTLNISGYMDNLGSLTNTKNGRINILEGALLICEGSELNNAGTININKNGGLRYDNGEFNNTMESQNGEDIGTLNVSGTFSVNTDKWTMGSSLGNTYLNSGKIEVSGEIESAYNCYMAAADGRLIMLGLLSDIETWSETGSTLTIVNDGVLNSALPQINKSLTLELGLYEINLQEAVTVASNGSLTIRGSGTLNKTNDDGNGIIEINDGGKLRLNDGTLSGVKGPVVRSGGECTVTGGSITCTDGVNVMDGGRCTVSGGSIVSANVGATVNDGGELTVNGGVISGINYGIQTVAGVSAATTREITLRSGCTVKSATNYVIFMDTNCSGLMEGGQLVLEQTGVIDTPAALNPGGEARLSLGGGRLLQTTDGTVVNWTWTSGMFG